MSEEQLRPLIVKHAKQAFKQTDNEAFPYNKHRVIVFLRVMNTLLRGMKEFFVPVLPLYFEKVLSCVQTFSQNQSGDGLLKRKKMGA
jgi:BP28CT (NUC211) domain